MPRAKKSDLLPELANSLEQWAIRYSLNADPYIVGLLQGMRSKKKIAFWADTRAVDMLPFPEATSGIATKKRLDALLAFRNIMVFVPIAFTWAAISQATTAFAEYAKLGEAKVVNFFDFWENGYGVLSPFWTLSNVARIDFLLLAVIIGFCLGSYLRRVADVNDFVGQRVIADFSRTRVLRGKPVQVVQCPLPYRRFGRHVVVHANAAQ